MPEALPFDSANCSMRARRKNSRNDAEVRVGCRPAPLEDAYSPEVGVDWQPKRTGLRSSTADADDHGSSPPISPGTRTVWNAGSHPRLASGLPASSENAYHPHQFGIHPGNRGSTALHPCAQSSRCANRADCVSSSDETTFRGGPPGDQRPSPTVRLQFGCRVEYAGISGQR